MRAILPLLWLPLAAWAAGAHEHGNSRLDIAVEAKTIHIAFATPLDNLVGFERAPRTDGERQRVAEALARLKDGEAMFRFDPAAGCKLARAGIDAPVLGQGKAPAGQGEHAELQADYVFDCTDAAKAGFLDVGLFEFNRLKRVQVQMALPKAQLKRELKRPNKRLVLGP
jgi:Protein of unknown function (DUF2796)